MATFRSARLSRQDIWLVFAASVFPIHAWSILQVANEVPAWILRLNLADVIGVIAYTQAFALLESLLVTAALVLAGSVLPRRWLADRFVAHSSLLIIVGALWMMALQQDYASVRQWNPAQFLPWAAAGLLSFFIPYALIQRHPGLDQRINGIVQRVSTLSGVYAALGVAGLLIVIVRNLW